MDLWVSNSLMCFSPLQLFLSLRFSHTRVYTHAHTGKTSLLMSYLRGPLTAEFSSDARAFAPTVLEFRSRPRVVCVCVTESVRDCAFGLHIERRSVQVRGVVNGVRLMHTAT